MTPAREMPGVWSVIAAEDAADHRHGLVINDQRLFASDRVRFEGEPVAAVAAETRAAARRAVAAMKFEVEPESPVVDLETAVASGRPPGTPRVGQLRSGW